MSPEPEMTSRKGKKVWTTLVTKPEYVAGLLTVNYTLQSVSAYPLVVMATNTLPESSRATIRSQGMEIIDVEHLAPAAGRHGGFDPKFSRFADTWTKLRVFDLVGHERVVMIDSDMIFLRGMDELFDMDLEDDWIAACPACVCNPFKIPHYPADWVPDNCQYAKQSRHCTIADIPNPKVDDPRTSHLLNSGLVVCKPSKDLMNGIEEYLNTSPTIPHLKFPDQDLLADYFKGRWKVLPWWCNALKTLRAVHQDIWADEEVRLIHFILEKPWNEPPPELYLQTIAYGEVDPSKQQLNYLPPTPVSATSFQQEKQQLRPLPPALLDLVKSTPAQKGITNYDDVHAWWWIAYDKVLEGLKQGLEAPWKEVDSFVHRR